MPGRRIEKEKIIAKLVKRFGIDKAAAESYYERYEFQREFSSSKRKKK